MARTPVCVLVLLLLATAAPAYDRALLPAHPPPVGYEKAKELRDQEGQVRQHANQLQARAEELWDAGRYERADELDDEAETLLSQARMLEARARAAELSPGIPTSRSALEPEP
jgi:hypothetical protein